MSPILQAKIQYCWQEGNKTDLPHPRSTMNGTAISAAPSTQLAVFGRLIPLTTSKSLDVNERYGWEKKWVIIMIENRGGIVHMWVSVLSVCTYSSLTRLIFILSLYPSLSSARRSGDIIYPASRVCKFRCDVKYVQTERRRSPAPNDENGPLVGFQYAHYS